MSEAIASADGGQGVAAATPAAAPSSTAAALTAAPAPVAATAPTSEQLAPAPAAPNPAAATIAQWLGQTDEVTQGYVANKGWDTPLKAVESYRNLEKLLGADKANNAIVIPKSDADAKEWGAVFDRLGRPSAPDGYKVAMPEGANPEFHNASLSKFHELGLTKAQGENLMSWYNEQVAQSNLASESERATRFAQEDFAVKQEWGAAYTQNLAQAQQAARGLGLDGNTIDKLSDALGHKATMNLLQRIGSKLTEDTFITPENPQGFGTALTPGQAKAEIQSLMSDRDFTKKYLAGDAGAKAKMESLHRYAYPES